MTKAHLEVTIIQTIVNGLLETAIDNRAPIEADAADRALQIKLTLFSYL